MSSSREGPEITQESRLKRDVGWNVASFAVLAISGLMLNVLIARIRGPEALGVFNQVFAFYIILSQIAVGGLQFSVLQKVSYHHSDRRLCGEIVASAMILVGGLAIVISACTFLLSFLVDDLLQSDAVAIGLRLVAPGLICYALSKVLIYILNGLSQLRAFAIFNALRPVLLLLFLLGLIYYDCPTSYLVLALTLTETTLLICLFGYIATRLIKLRIGPDFRTHVRNHFSYGAKGILSGVLHEFNTRVDVLMLGYFLADRNVGIYSFAAILAEGFGQLPTALRRTVDPVIGRHFAASDISSINDFVVKIRRQFSPLIVISGLIAVLIFPICLRIVVDPIEFSGSWTVFAILMLGITINATYRPFYGVLLQGNRPGYHSLLVAGVFLSNVILNATLIPIFGLVGAAIATCCAFLIEVVILTFLAQQTLGIRLSRIGVWRWRFDRRTVDPVK